MGGTGRLAVIAVQLVALAARRMTVVTVSAREIRARWPALTSVMRAPARWAMDCSKAGGMTLSAVPMTAHDGMVFQAGVPDGSPSVLAARGRCVAAMIAAVGAGGALVKESGTRGRLMEVSTAPGGATGEGTEIDSTARVPSGDGAGERHT